MPKKDKKQKKSLSLAGDKSFKEALAKVGVFPVDSLPPELRSMLQGLMDKQDMSTTKVRNSPHLHDHPHHVPVIIEVNAKVIRQHPWKGVREMYMEGVFLDTSPDGSPMEPGHHEQALEELLSELRKSLTEALNAPEGAQPTTPEKEFTRTLRPIKEGPTH